MGLARRIGNLFRRSQVDREIDAELEAHIALRAEDNIARGMTPAEAHRDARVRFGNSVLTRESVAATEMPLLFTSIWTDIRYAIRQMIKNPGFAMTATLVLALGMGASVAIFAFVDAMLIKPLPYQAPSRLVTLFESNQMGPRFHLSYLDYLDYKKLNHVFTDVESYDENPFSLQSPTGIERVDGVAIGAGFFQMLGITPTLGRDFRPDEDTPGAPRTVILSYSTWQKRFGGQQDVLGKTVNLDGTSFEVAGVLPREFYFAPAGAAEFWIPMLGSMKPDSRGEHGILAFARLKDGIELQTASTEMNRIADLLAKQYPDADGGRGATVVSLTEIITGNLRPTLLLLLSGATLLLLIACVNVSGLLLVRAQSRQREIAVRGTLGASRTRLIRQFVTEAVVLTAVGSSCGIGIAYVSIRLLRQLLPLNVLESMPYLQTLGFNAHSILFTLAIAVASAALLSLIAILRAPFINLRAGLAETSRSSAGSVWRHMGARMVMLELFTATILLVGAGLLCKSFYKLLHVETGFKANHLATMRISAAQTRYSSNKKILALARQLMERVRQLPGVTSVAIAHQIPITNVAGGSTTFLITGRGQNQESNEANGREVSTEFFSTIGARLQRGRWFTESDDASKPLVAIVNQAFAQKYLANEDPIGKHIQFDTSAPQIEIVGVVEDIREGTLDTAVQSAIYTPFNQAPNSVFYIVARTLQAPKNLLVPLEGTVHKIDPGILVLRTETMEDRIQHLQATYLHRASAWLVGGFAAMALLLGIIGLYGVIAYSVSQRTREIGVRMALGAQRSLVYHMVLREAGWLATAGICAGLVSAVLAGTLMQKLLFGTQAWDIPTLATVSALMLFSALLASYLPARRAASINPVDALRAE